MDAQSYDQLKQEIANRVDEDQILLDQLNAVTKPELSTHYPFGLGFDIVQRRAFVLRMWIEVFQDYKKFLTINEDEIREVLCLS